ncbi:sigma-70 family RNA polymerase sigma factor [Paraconexibacter antarcticus]|uniref:RNA polymerase sigma factor n=1 Tax=Paraconexibacter antarcticus TaxID=2949664 RepID=A0ABY5E1S8_9ACTN|nr:sigma-70 family RNA polymerase sigma factor [Paraconexibacter antarcticus]UTI64362.1 sigma-70 family RNA polymerase sigma factor [Paraconexibacter antarcticus]UTI66792.1 sigma-70 family RNA polymerase sigma factor [Paraconexibacter antarcticus]
MSPPHTLPSPTGLLARRLPVRSSAVRADCTLFSQVYREHHQDLYRYIRSILRDPADAEDVLQSVMVKAIVALQQEDRDFELRPWLFRIAHNEAINRIRQQRPTSELDTTHASKGPPTSDMVADRDRLKQLWSDLTLLPDRQRQALVLRELSGLSHQEIAKVLDCAPTVVKQTIFEARTALAELAEGRAMQCDEIQRKLSDGDGRVRRGRRMRGHLASCSACRHFDLALTARPQELGALFPVLPVAASAALLGHLFHTGGAAAKGGALTAGAGGAAGTTSTVAAAITTKMAVLAATGVAAAGATGVAVHHHATTHPAPRTSISSNGPANTAGHRAATSGPAATPPATAGTSRRAASSRASGPTTAGGDSTHNMPQAHNSATGAPSQTTAAHQPSASPTSVPAAQRPAPTRIRPVTATPSAPAPTTVTRPNTATRPPTSTGTAAAPTTTARPLTTTGPTAAPTTPTTTAPVPSSSTTTTPTASASAPTTTSTTAPTTPTVPTSGGGSGTAPRSGPGAGGTAAG